MEKIKYFKEHMARFDESLDWIQDKIEKCDSEEEMNYFIRQLEEEQDFLLKLQAEFESFCSSGT